MLFIVSSISFYNYLFIITWISLLGKLYFFFFIFYKL